MGADKLIRSRLLHARRAAPGYVLVRNARHHPACRASETALWISPNARINKPRSGRMYCWCPSGLRNGDLRVTGQLVVRHVSVRRACPAMRCWRLSCKQLQHFPYHDHDEAVNGMVPKLPLATKGFDDRAWQQPARLVAHYHDACPALEELLSLPLFLQKSQCARCMQ